MSRPTRIVLVLIAIFSLTGRLAAGQKIIDLHASATDVIAGSHGRVLVLVFLRTDCPISNRYAPLIQEMSRKYARDASFQLIFPDRNESQQKIEQFLKDYHYQLPAIRDVDHVLARKTLVKVTPEAAVFGRRGELLYRGRIDNLYEHIGQARRAATTHELAVAIDAAIKGVKVPISTVDGVGCFIADVE